MAPDGPMRVIGRWGELSQEERSAVLSRGLDRIFDPGLQESIATLVADVRRRGDEAVCEATERFDKVRLEPGRLRVGDEERERAHASIDPALLEAIRDAIAHVRRFNEHLAAETRWSIESEPGLFVGEKVTPIESAGLFVPGGKATYPSVLVQIGTPAVVAGVGRIAVVVPPVPGGGGDVDPAVLAVAVELGIADVFRANGPAGVAALAFGTETVPRTRKVLGPGSPAVTCAQVEVQRYGTVTTMLLGPSESLILADDSADPRLLAADLLNEAEHGDDSASLLVTDSEQLLAATELELARQLDALPEPFRGHAAAAIGRNGGAVLVADLAEGARVANAYAPEHCMIVVRDEEAVLDLLHDAGEILIGQQTPFASGNFLLGPPATLPTSGFAKVSSGVTAQAFLKRTAVARADATALRRMAPSILSLARHEGFPAHEAAVRARLEPGR